MVLCRTLACLGFAWGAIGLGESAEARARIPIPVFWGQGEELTDLGELPTEIDQAIKAELEKSVRVGFLYERVYLFGLDLWTWNGRHVLFNNDGYFEPPPEAWQDWLGTTPAKKYGIPWLYRIPILGVLLAAAAIIFLLRKFVFKSEQAQLQALANHPRYKKAIETIFDAGDSESPQLVTTVDPARFEAAKRELVSTGIDAQTADTNLRKLTEAYDQVINGRIDAFLQAASQLDEQGEREHALQIYQQVAEALPAEDERREFALAEIGEIQTALKTGEPDSPPEENV